MINPIWLKTFCTLAEMGHFTKTASALFMTQSGVSQQIKKLEQQLDTPLLIREGKSFILTDAGLQLYEEGRKLLQVADLLEHKVKQDDPFSGRVRIATTGSVGISLYPFLLDVQQQHPKLAMLHSFAPNTSIERDISSRHVDVGIMTQATASSELVSEAIAKEELVLVTDNSIQDINWMVLMKLGFISHPDGHYHCQALLRQNFPEFEHPSQLRENGFSNQINLILEPVSRGFGFTVLPLRAVNAFHKQARIRIHALTHSVHETLYLCRHTQVAQSRRVLYVSQRIQGFIQTVT